MRDTIRTAALGVAALAAVVLAACSPADPDSPPLPTVAPEVLQFTGVTTDGEPFEGESLFGQPTVIWVWAEWCPICQGEAPHVREALDELPEGVQVVGLSGFPRPDQEQRFIDDYDLGGITHISDPSGAIWDHLGVSYQPSIYLVDAAGNTKWLPGAVGKEGFLKAAASISGGQLLVSGA